MKIKSLLSAFRRFRQRHLFVFPKEAAAAIAIARQLSVEELEAEKKRYQDAAFALMRHKVSFKRSTHEYKCEFTVDAKVCEDKDLALKMISGRIARDILEKHYLRKN